MKENNEIDTLEVVILVDNVKKSFKSYKDKATSFKERFVNPSRGKHEDVMVLKGISFEVHKGEAIGIIGKNGCGKSTTLKMLTRILYPNEGKIEIKGRVSSLIELGAGFHPDMTGRENIYTNASIFGITRKEVDRRLNDIIRFSELEEYIDNPVRTYSSGMYMRLAFAVAINVDADVLLIDEILAVGDSAFQKKCFDKLKEIKANGTTIVIVSHSMDQMYKICDKLIWIENGLIKDEGTPKFIGEAYLAAMEGRRLDRIEFENQQKKEELERKIKEEQERLRIEQEKEEKKRQEEEKRQKEEEKRKEAERQKEEEKRKKQEELLELERKQRELELNETLRTVCTHCYPMARRLGGKDIFYTKVKIEDLDGNEVTKIWTRQKYQIVLNYDGCGRKDEEVKFVVGITRNDGTYCYGTSMKLTKQETENLKPGCVKFIFENKLLKGKYMLDLWVENTDGVQYDSIFSLMQIEVESNPYNERGILTMEHHWERTEQ